MLSTFVIAITAFAASLLTFFSGFGLGTILTPVFAIFFPIDLAIALTAIVHLLNNLFKFLLVGRYIDKAVALKFGITAIIGAFAGAYFLTQLSEIKPLFNYRINDHEFSITPIKITIALLMVVFALFEIIPYLKNIEFKPNKLPLGGLVSGFFGGLSGHQGALRSAFLIRYGLSKESFIATGILIACLIDFTRLAIYFRRFDFAEINGNIAILSITTLSAFLGAYIGSKLLKKITVNSLQIIVTVVLFIIAVLLGLGII